MKRDDEFIRKILLDLEDSAEISILAGLEVGPDEDEEKLFYHLQLLCDAGLMVEMQRSVFRMTNQGHDFVAAVRTEGIWNKTKAGASQLGGVTLGILKDIAVSYLKQEAKKTLGLDLP
ncbi:DUF2513 domain-containing protein [Oryzifoliimicrobium ureilyticus]|uniref:DUF2513 domain-containing protein n=1 Tax=Oryzifoliimicrobium ureilyticus TaxID=3113724 RepID=UPI0030762114